MKLFDRDSFIMNPFRLGCLNMDCKIQISFYNAENATIGVNCGCIHLKKPQHVKEGKYDLHWTEQPLAGFSFDVKLPNICVKNGEKEVRTIGQNSHGRLREKWKDGEVWWWRYSAIRRQARQEQKLVHFWGSQLKKLHRILFIFQHGYLSTLCICWNDFVNKW